MQLKTKGLALQFSILLIVASCSNNAPVIVKEEVAPPPEIYTSANAVQDLSKVTDQNVDDFISKVSRELKDDASWTEFWKYATWQLSSYSWSEHTLERVLELSNFSCYQNASSAFGMFIQKLLNTTNPYSKDKIALASLRHFNGCQMHASAIELDDYLRHFEQTTDSDKILEFVQMFSSINQTPSSRQIISVSLLTGHLNQQAKLQLYRRLKENTSYRNVARKLIENMDFMEIVSKANSGEILFEDAISTLEAILFKIRNVNQAQVENIFTFIQNSYQHALTTIDKFNVSSFHFKVLLTLDQKNLEHVENWAAYLLANSEDVLPFYPNNSLAYRFVKALIFESDEKLEESSVSSTFEKLLILRANINIENDLETLVSLDKELCDFYQKNFNSSPTFGCKLVNSKVTIDQDMSIFSSLSTNGHDVEVRGKMVKLSIINTSRGKEFKDLPAVSLEDDYRSMVIPMVIGFSPLRDVSRFKAGTTHYLAINHIYRDASILVPGLENVPIPQEGRKAGDLIIDEQSLTKVKFIALGGEGQKASPPKMAAEEYRVQIDEFSIRSWVESFAGNNNYYLSDNFKSLRNLRNLFQASTDESNKLNIYIDPDYINALSSEQKSGLLRDLQIIRQKERFDNLTDIEILEVLARRTMRTFFEKTDVLALSSTVREVFPAIFSQVVIDRGNIGVTYPDGKRGRNGQIIVR